MALSLFGWETRLILIIFMLKLLFPSAFCRIFSNMLVLFSQFEYGLEIKSFMTVLPSSLFPYESTCNCNFTSFIYCFRVFVTKKSTMLRSRVVVDDA